MHLSRGVWFLIKVEHRRSAIITTVINRPQSFYKNGECNRILVPLAKVHGVTMTYIHALLVALSVLFGNMAVETLVQDSLVSKVFGSFATITKYVQERFNLLTAAPKLAV